jgi:hypothetical protein
MESNVAASLELGPASESDLDFVYRVTETARRVCRILDPARRAAYIALAAARVTAQAGRGIVSKPDRSQKCSSTS